MIYLLRNIVGYGRKKEISTKKTRESSTGVKYFTYFRFSFGLYTILFYNLALFI